MNYMNMNGLVLIGVKVEYKSKVLKILGMLLFCIITCKNTKKVDNAIFQKRKKQKRCR